MTHDLTADFAPRTADVTGAHKRMSALQQHINGAGLDVRVTHLIKLRASQVNGCAFCIDMHVDEALADGLDAKLLHLVAVWREVDAFDAREQAALALTEAITLVSETHVPRAVFDQAAAVFSEQELGAVIWQAIAINAWNRLSITMRTTPASLAATTTAA
jgi:AhpD family alkylhydroperoxidase